MALTAYPFDAQTVSETQYGDLFGGVAQSGIVASPASNNFKVTAGGSNMTLTVTAVGGASRALVRGHAVLMTADISVTVGTASAAARADLVVLRLNYTDNSIQPVVRPGTSGSTTPPDPYWGTSGFYEIPLAIVTVGAGVTTINNTNLTDARRFTGPSIGSWTTASRPTVPLSFGYNTTLSVWEYTANGTTWTTMGTVDLASGGATGVLPAGKGGTGRDNLNQVRGDLGLGGDTSKPLQVANGGTGGTTVPTARQGLDIFVQPAAPAHQAGRIWIKTAS